MPGMLVLICFGGVPASWHVGQKVKNQENSDWEQASRAPAYNILDSGAIRAALLFGSAAVAFTLILAPIIDRGAGNIIGRRGVSQGLDATATGSILKKRSYTVRRSILQGGPSSVCIIGENGAQSGEC
jgi:hypothetical protein